jgi:hypothetical protein
MSLSFTPVYTNSGTGSNQNPFDPSNWSQFISSDNFQILGGAVETTTLYTGDAQGVNTTISWPSSPDQYTKAKLTYLNPIIGSVTGAAFWLYLRANSVDGSPLFRFSISTLADNQFGYYVDVLSVNNSQGTIYTLAESQTGGDGFGDVYLNFVNGDVFTFAIIGPVTSGNLYVLRNGSVLFTAPLNMSDGQNPSATGPNSGYPGMQLDVTNADSSPDPLGPSTDVQINNIEIGTVSGSLSGAYSQPDCRNFGNFPNNSVNINGTLTYTVQKFESRAAGAPTDSRAAGAPVASGTYPQNSRTPGIFGPDE